MPTGYTAMLGEKNATFNEYAWACARGFGALLCLRDEPWDTPIPLRLESNGYYLNQIENAKKKLKHLEERSDDYFAVYFAEESEKLKEHQGESEKKSNELREKYSTALATVDAWLPPSDDHVKFKEFMASQIKESIQWDCRSLGENKRTEPMKTLRQLKKDAIDQASRDVEYYEKQHVENEARIAGNNEWLKALQDSIGLPPNWVAVRKIHLWNKSASISLTLAIEMIHTGVGLVPLPRSLQPG